MKMIVKPIFMLLVVGVLAAMAPQVDSTKLLVKKVLLTAPLVKAAKAKVGAIAKGKAIVLETAIKLPGELLKSNVKTVARVFTQAKLARLNPPNPVAAALKVLLPAAALAGLAGAPRPAVVNNGFNFPSLFGGATLLPQFIANANSNSPAADAFVTGANALASGANVLASSANAVAAGSNAFVAGSKAAEAGSNLVRDAVTSVGLSALSNVASDLSNAAGAVDNLQTGFLTRFRENPIVSYVQSALQQPAPSPVAYNFWPYGITEYRTVQYRPTEYTFEHLPGSGSSEAEKPVETSTPASEPEEHKGEKPAYPPAIPAETYGVPAQTYGLPSPVYKVPSPIYEVPSPTYELPAPAHELPTQTYGLPAEAPRQDFAVYYP